MSPADGAGCSCICWMRRGRWVTSTGCQSLVVKALFSKCIVCYMFLKNSHFFASALPLQSSVTGVTCWLCGSGGALFFLRWTTARCASSSPGMSFHSPKIIQIGFTSKRGSALKDFFFSFNRCSSLWLSYLNTPVLIL